MPNSQLVTAHKPRTGGCIFRAPLGTKLPTSAIEELAKEFTELGYLSDDGITNSHDMSVDTEKAFGGDTINVLDQGKTETFQYKLMETLNVDVLKEAYGDDNVTGTLETGITVKSNSKEHDAHAYVIDTILKGGILKREVIPEGRLSDFGDVAIKDSESAGYELTITAMPDSEGNDHYKYIQKPTNG